MSEKPHIFTQHSRSWQTNRYVYPVISRRAKGLSIGVNLNPDKVCNFDCVYCCVNRAIPPAVREVDLNILAEELDDLLSLATTGELFQQPPLDQTPPQLRRLNDVAFSGDGEPTSYSRFKDACELAAKLLKKHGRSQAKIVVITNATLLHRPAVREAMEVLDRNNGEIWAKLEAGTEAYYRQVERTSIPLQRVLDNIRDAGRVRPIVIQSLFMKINGVGPSETEIAAYLQRLSELKAQGCQVKLVQVYTVARKTAEVYVTPLEAIALSAIAERVKRLGLNVEWYAGVE